VAVVALVVALAGLWLLVRGNNDGAA
jgi:hypothetical protein